MRVTPAATKTSSTETALSAACETRDLFAAISNKWVGLVLVALAEGPRRYSELHHVIEGISQKMLTQSLRLLERDGLVTRTPSVADKRRVGLSLTDEGQRLLRRVRSRRTAWLVSRLGKLTPAELASIEAAIEPLSQLLAVEDRP